MTTPYRVAIDASNQPTAAQNYEHGGTALTGFLSPSAGLTDGQRVVLSAEQVDGNGAPAGAFEFVESTWNDSTTDFFSRDTLLRSSSGSLIDWSAAGVNAVPRLRVVAALEGSPVELVAAGSFSTATQAIVVGVSPAFKAGWDYEIHLDELVSGATSHLTALFWDPVAGDWDAASSFSVGGYGAYGVTSLAIVTNNVGFAYMNASNAANTNGSPWGLRMQLYDPANAGGFTHGSIVNGYTFSGQKTRQIAALRCSNEALAHTGVGFVQSTGDFASGRYWCIGKRRPYV